MLPLRVDVAGSVAAEDNDTILIDAAMRCLQVLEFDFFRAAWRFWNGIEPDDRQIEPGFVRYLFTQQAPGYVRQFAHRVLRDAAASAGPTNRMLPEDRPPEHPDARREVVLSTSIFFAAAILLAVM